MQSTDQCSVVFTIPNRKEYVTAHGSIDELFNIIKQNKINIEFSDVVYTLRKYTDAIEDQAQRSIFSAYYWRKMSVVEIRTMLGYKTNGEVTTLLNKGLEAYIKALHYDVGQTE